MIVTLTPNPSLDRTVHLDRLERGHVHRARRENEEPSGKGVNVTRALAANGVRSVAVLPVGGAAGEEIAARLRAAGVAHVGVPVAGAVRANVSLVEADGTTTKINGPGPALSADENAALLDAVGRAAADGAAWVVGAGSLPPGADPALYAAAAEVSRDAGARFALDSSGAALAAGLEGRPDVVKPNVDELAEAVDAPVLTVGDAVAGARALLARGARTVLVSLGPDGALLVDAEGARHAEAEAPVVRSTVGAGDALLAGYVAAPDGADPLRWALAWATAAVGVEGSAVPWVGAEGLARVRIGVPDVARELRDPALCPAVPSGR
ncbi:1-phosphofructokinase family hexose kinase [Patulibacter americanus]|uniref:1-phosphofructokinase family hexose kinase n=1 Tax=Patulibacter americanus TaxID=588672 RepID=UPI0003B564FF|nr:1-phosphofructokinase family hexose kinase [Patulibacter americanus]